jgi:hypothetical protein
MTGAALTQAAADALVAAEKIVTADVVWRCQPPGWRLQVRVLAVASKEIMELRGQIGRTNHSFALLYQNLPLRRYTKHARHPLPNGRVLTVPHKHTWDPEYGDVDAYVPEDIHPADDVNDQFLAFCRECHIELVGTYQRVAYQL